MSHSAQAGRCGISSSPRPRFGKATSQRCVAYRFGNRLAGHGLPKAEPASVARVGSWLAFGAQDTDLSGATPAFHMSAPEEPSFVNPQIRAPLRGGHPAGGAAHVIGPARRLDAGTGGPGPRQLLTGTPMTDEQPGDGIKLVVAELLRGEPVVARWEVLEAVGTTVDDWLHEVRDVAARAGIRVTSTDLANVEMTAVFNSDVPAPDWEAVQNKVNTSVAERKVRAAMAKALAEPEEEQ